MRIATATPIKIRKSIISRIETNSAEKSINVNITASHLETAVKHYLLYNLDILLEVSKQEKMEGDLETAAAIIREYEFLSLVNDSKSESLKSLLHN